jgi:hypothetical protein
LKADQDIIEEVQRVRQALAAQEGNDMRRILAAALKRQNESGRAVVSGSPRPVMPSKPPSTPAEVA